MSEEIPKAYGLVQRDHVFMRIEDYELLKRENAALREALKKARLLARVNGYSMREFALKIGITPMQLSKWTDSTPNREPDFKD